MYNEELCNLYSSQNIIRMITSRRMRLEGYAAVMGEKSAYRVIVGKPEGKKPVCRPRPRWGDIKIDLKVIR
jgi:hypothetical protein